MMVYIVLEYDDDTDILGVFSSAEKANTYIKYLDTITTGTKYVIPMEMDKIDEEDDEWLEFNRDYIKYHNEKDI